MKLHRFEFRLFPKVKRRRKQQQKAGKSEQHHARVTRAPETTSNSIDINYVSNPHYGTFYDNHALEIACTEDLTHDICRNGGNYENCSCFNRPDQPMSRSFDSYMLKQRFEADDNFTCMCDCQECDIVNRNDIESAGKSKLNLKHNSLALSDSKDNTAAVSTNTLPRSRTRIKTNPWLPSPLITPSASVIDLKIASPIQDQKQLQEMPIYQVPFNKTNGLNLRTKMSPSPGDDLGIYKTVSTNCSSSETSGIMTYTRVKNPKFRTNTNFSSDEPSSVFHENTFSDTSPEALRPSSSDSTFSETPSSEDIFIAEIRSDDLRGYDSVNSLCSDTKNPYRLIAEDKSDINNCSNTEISVCDAIRTSEHRDMNDNEAIRDLDRKCNTKKGPTEISSESNEEDGYETFAEDNEKPSAFTEDTVIHNMQDSIDTGYASASQDLDLGNFSSDDEPKNTPDNTSELEWDNAQSIDISGNDPKKNDSLCDSDYNKNDMAFLHVTPKSEQTATWNEGGSIKDTILNTMSQSYCPSRAFYSQVSVDSSQLAKKLSPSENVLARFYPKRSRSLMDIYQSLDEKVMKLREEKVYVQRKIQESMNEDLIRQRQQKVLETLTKPQRKNVLLQSLNDLKARLENQNARLQSSYVTVLSLRKQIGQ